MTEKNASSKFVRESKSKNFWVVFTEFYILLKIIWKQLIHICEAVLIQKCEKFIILNA